MLKWFINVTCVLLVGIAAQALVFGETAIPTTDTDSVPGAESSPQRIVSLGGTVTEIVYELGKGELLAGNDLSSIYPSQATTLPRVGYYRDLSVEGLVSLNSDLILASEQAGPPAVLKRVQDLGIPVKTISDDGTLDSLYKRIRQIADALHITDQGQHMEQRVRTQIQAAINAARLESVNTKPVRAIMLMKRTSHVQAAGSNTTAAALLELAGLQNIVATQQGYKPISTESLAALQPELIITTQSSLDAMGGKHKFIQSPGIRLTPAAQQGNILVMDDLLILGLGPRTAQTIDQLTAARKQVINTR